MKSQKIFDGHDSNPLKWIWYKAYVITWSVSCQLNYAEQKSSSIQKFEQFQQEHQIWKEKINRSCVSWYWSHVDFYKKFRSISVEFEFGVRWNAHAVLWLGGEKQSESLVRAYGYVRMRVCMTCGCACVSKWMKPWKRERDRIREPIFSAVIEYYTIDTQLETIYLDNCINFQTINIVNAWLKSQPQRQRRRRR